jgi:hypothetical protein
VKVVDGCDLETVLCWKICAWGCDLGSTKMFAYGVQ